MSVKKQVKTFVDDLQRAVATTDAKMKKLVKRGDSICKEMTTKESNEYHHCLREMRSRIRSIRRDLVFLWRASEKVNGG